jgi:hypothetical protein
MTALAEMETGDIMAADSSEIGDKEAYAKPNKVSWPIGESIPKGWQRSTMTCSGSLAVKPPKQYPTE